MCRNIMNSFSKPLLFLLLVLSLYFCKEPQPPTPPARPFHIINLSFPRSGTTSFAGIFNRYPATHEFMRTDTINAILDWRENKISKDQLKAFLFERDQKAGHYVDSAAFFFLAPEILIETFPDSKFFFVIRDCESWLLSLADMEIEVLRGARDGTNSIDLSYHDRYAQVFTPKFSRDKFLDERNLKANLSPMLPDLAEAWKAYTIRVLMALKNLPTQKRLIIRLEHFNRSVPQFAQLAGLRPENLNIKNIHLNPDIRSQKIKLLFGSDLSHAARARQLEVENWIRQNFPTLITETR